VGKGVEEDVLKVFPKHVEVAKTNPKAIEIKNGKTRVLRHEVVINTPRNQCSNSER
jgi:hypothetical protein